MTIDPDLAIDSDVASAETLPGRFYTDPVEYRAAIERVLLRGWHVVARGDQIARGRAHPVTLLPGCLDEPILLVRDAAGVLHAMSNVCTHRGAVLVDEACAVADTIRCPYHGRRFELDGRFRSMPEMEGVKNFPSPGDDLRRLAVKEWGPLVFVSFDPVVPFETLIEPVERRVSGFDVGSWPHEPSRTERYDVAANWALYVDNFLEGFHIPYVHPALAKVLDYRQYTSVVDAWASVQIGVARPEEPAFELPPEHPDAALRVGAYYFFLFPATMLNFYPWGLSLNVVLPTGIDRTTVVFEPFVADPTLLDRGAGGALDLVQREDEQIVAAVQRGVRSRAYQRGRYSATREACVHQFHRTLLTQLRP